MAAFAADSVCSVLWGGMLILKKQSPGNIYGSQVAPLSWGPALAVGDNATTQKYLSFQDRKDSPILVNKTKQNNTLLLSPMHLSTATELLLF